MHFQHSVVELRRDFRTVGIFRQREAASKSAIASLDAMEFLFEIFLLAFAFSGNAKNAVFDSYPNVILLHFRQVSFEQIPAIILTDVNLRRPICDRKAVDLATAHSIRKAAQEERIEAILCRLFHLSKRIQCYYFIQCSFYLPFWIQLKPSWCIALTAYCQSRPESCAGEELTVLGFFWESVLMVLQGRLFAEHALKSSTSCLGRGRGAMLNV